MVSAELMEKLLEALISVLFILSVPTLFAFLPIGLFFLFLASAVLNPAFGLLVGRLGGFLLGISSAAILFLSVSLPFMFADAIKTDRNLLAIATIFILTAGYINVFVSYMFLENLMMVKPLIGHIITLVAEIAILLFLLYATIENIKCLLGIEC